MKLLLLLLLQTLWWKLHEIRTIHTKWVSLKRSLLLIILKHVATLVLTFSIRFVKYSAVYRRLSSITREKKSIALFSQPAKHAIDHIVNNEFTEMYLGLLHGLTCALLNGWCLLIYFCSLLTFCPLDEFSPSIHLHLSPFVVVAISRSFASQCKWEN